jgi:hypothetical protein
MVMPAPWYFRSVGSSPAAMMLWLATNPALSCELGAFGIQVPTGVLGSHWG